MDASQQSCDQAYDCSAAELNELARLCVSEGAVGSRLTGALSFPPSLPPCARPRNAGR